MSKWQRPADMQAALDAAIAKRERLLYELRQVRGDVYLLKAMRNCPSCGVATLSSPTCSPCWKRDNPHSVGIDWNGAATARRLLRYADPEHPTTATPAVSGSQPQRGDGAK